MWGLIETLTEDLPEKWEILRVFGYIVVIFVIYRLVALPLSAVKQTIRGLR